MRFLWLDSFSTDLVHCDEVDRLVVGRCHEGREHMNDQDIAVGDEVSVLGKVRTGGNLP